MKKTILLALNCLFALNNYEKIFLFASSHPYWM